MEKGLEFEAYVESVIPSENHPGESVLQVEDGARWNVQINPLNKEMNLLGEKRVQITTDASGKIIKLLLLDPGMNDHKKTIYPIYPQEKARRAQILENDEPTQSKYASKIKRTKDYLAVFDVHIPRTTEKYTIQQMADIEFACTVMDLIYDNKYIVDYIEQREDAKIKKDEFWESLLMSSYMKYMQIAQYTPVPHTFEEFLMAISLC